ncbi:WXG100 family type VII secretion target [Gulosibacter bifidus]|uniref:ESAT-6-like protein n=1 Tax=Gulosibacter bifidus TaxID=272239 RepID=A0ABW5RJC5_9MICO|nr:WXG100 family type VII secretion target [Gulosibacter bifidus]
MDIRVNYGTMESAQQQLSQGNSNIENTLDGLETQLNGMVAQWEGSAQGAYQNARAQWDNAMAQMKVALNKLNQLMGETAMDMNATDRKGANRFGG